MDDPFLRPSRDGKPRNTILSRSYMTLKSTQRNTNSVRRDHLSASFVSQPKESIYSDVATNGSQLVERSNIYSYRKYSVNGPEGPSQNILNQSSFNAPSQPRPTKDIPRQSSNLRGSSNQTRNFLNYDFNQRGSSNNSSILNQQPINVESHVNCSNRVTAYDLMKPYSEEKGPIHIRPPARAERLGASTERLSYHKNKRPESFDQSQLDYSLDRSRLVSSIGRSNAGHLGGRFTDQPAPVHLLSYEVQNQGLSGRSMNFADHLVRFN